MPYEPSSGGRLKQIGLTVVGVVAALVVGAIVRDGTDTAIQHAQTSPDSVRSELEALRNATPSVGRTFAALEEHYPERYEALLEEISTALRNGETKDEIRQRGFNFTRSLALEASEKVHRAPNAELRAVMLARKSALETLSEESASMCANFAGEGLKPDDRPSEAIWEKIGRTTEALFEAAAAAEESGVLPLEPTNEAWRALGDGMLERGVSDDELEKLANGNLYQLSDARFCRVAIALLDTLEAMPERDGLAIYRFMQAPQ